MSLHLQTRLTKSGYNTRPKLGQLLLRQRLQALFKAKVIPLAFLHTALEHLRSKLNGKPIYIARCEFSKHLHIVHTFQQLHARLMRLERV